jgi:SAM-dependent methyltransferase
MNRKASTFPFLRYPLQSFEDLRLRLATESPTKLKQLLATAKYPVRLLRYWWAGHALRQEAQRLGRPLRVVDLGCERGWLKHFTPEGAVAHWTGLDWNVQAEVTRLAGYHEVHNANFDEPLPLGSGVADAVVSLHVFEHLPRPGITMAEVGRVLRPGGIFLAGAPTMPHWLARLRERYFRRRFQEGKVAPGGHITVLSPERWRSLAEDAGMDVGFVTGSHALRLTGSPLENWRGWVRLNQLWGALLPSLGSECYILARRKGVWQEGPARLAPEDPHWRPLWVTLGALSIALLGLLGFGVGELLEERRERDVLAWMDAHQTGDDIFIVTNDGLEEICEGRKDLHCADSVSQLLKLAEQYPKAHVLVTVPTAMQLSEATINEASPGSWRIDSRMDFDDTDYLLLRKDVPGTCLNEYLLGALQWNRRSS